MVLTSLPPVSLDLLWTNISTQSNLWLTVTLDLLVDILKKNLHINSVVVMLIIYFLSLCENSRCRLMSKLWKWQQSSLLDYQHFSKSFSNLNLFSN